MAFQSPNYTQTPNDFFTMIPDMSDAELRVTVVMIRQTFGFHRDGFKLGVTKIAKAAGLSRQGTLDGAAAAEKRGTFRRTNPEAITEAEWELVVSLYSVDDPSTELIPPLQPVEGYPLLAGGQVGVKERIKKSPKEGEPPALDFKNMTVGQARKVPTLKMFYEATGWMPADVLWEVVHETIIKHSLTAEKIKPAAIAWVGRGYKRGNVAGILEWAVNGIPTNGKNGVQPATPAPARDPYESLLSYLDDQEKQS